MSFSFHTCDTYLYLWQNVHSDSLFRFVIFSLQSNISNILRNKKMCYSLLLSSPICLSILHYLTLSMTHIMYYLHFEEYAIRLELLLTALKLRSAGSNPRGGNFVFFIFFFKHYLCVSWITLGKKNVSF
jgi:hypothetical protein